MSDQGVVGNVDSHRLNLVEAVRQAARQGTREEAGER